MAECHIADGEMLELCNDYYDVFDTPEVNGVPAEVKAPAAASKDKKEGEEEKKKDGDGDGDTAMGEAAAAEGEKLSQLQLAMPGGGSEPAWVFALGRVVLFGALAEYSNHQVGFAGAGGRAAGREIEREEKRKVERRGEAMQVC